MSHPKAKNLFFELLLVATGGRNNLEGHYTYNDWVGAYDIASEQAIEGYLMSALEVLQKNDGVIPSKELLLQWIGMTQMIEQNTQKLAKASDEVVDYFRKNGFACTILKGASVGRYYPQPNRRSSGDVDVWLKGGRKEIYDFARKHDKDRKLHGVTYHHIHYHLFDDVEVEVHIWPSFLSSPLRNHRLQKFCELHEPTLDTRHPSLAFDRVFILLHCYQHLCGHGVGFRQLIDYYYVLKQGFSVEEKEETVYWIKKLGMHRFCRGLMWLFKNYLGLEEEYLFVEPSEKEGQFVLNEVMQTGNMGHTDKRNWGSTKTPISRFFFKLHRDAYLVTHYPHEALWQPLFSIWLYSWRLIKGL